ncbi:MAG TPA: type II secretion system protein [Gemmatimonadales bacterium]|nr:type II secretion system protein [Gemmatimonadales bacterium]
MNDTSEHGMTIVEILVAIVVLAIGLLALAGGSLVVTRNLTGGRMAMVASARADAQLDELRAIAASTPVRCTSANFANSAGPQTIDGVTLAWRIVPNAGAERHVYIRTQYALPGGRGSKVDTLRAVIGC